MGKLIEEWRPIQGYEGLYEVSDWARVRSLDRIVEQIHSISKKPFKRKYKGTMLRQFNDGTNHLFVNLSKGGVSKPYYVHQLVAQAFISNTNCYTVVHHKDENPLNNCIENLEWISKLEHDIIHGRNPKTVYQYTLDGELVAIWTSANEAAKTLGILASHICECCKYERKTYKRYKWSYILI